MLIKKFKIRKLSCLLSLSMLLSCVANNDINKVTKVTIPSAVTSLKPVGLPTPANISGGSDDSGPPPTVVPVLSPASSLLPTMGPSPTGITTDISDRATLNGKVFDESGNPLNGIKVSIKSLEKNFPLAEEGTTSNGSYVFRNMPVGIRLQLDVFKNEKWTQRSQSIVLKSNLSGNSSSNTMDFGDTHNVDDPQKSNFFFISDAPEVISITPNRNTKVKHYGINVNMVFSEPVEKETVEKNFIIRYVNSEISANIAPGDGTASTTNTDGPPLILKNKQVIIAKDTIECSFAWKNNDGSKFGKEVTFSLSHVRGVPVSNKNKTLYSISLRNRAGDVRIKDVEGNTGISYGEFFNEGKRSRNIVMYVDADKTQPYLESINLGKVNPNSIIILTFSEPMVLENTVNSDLTDLSFYTIYKNGSPIKLEDVTFRTLTPNVLEIYSKADTFQRNDVIKVEVDPNLKDPAGNFFSQGITLGQKDNLKELKFNPN